MIGRSRFFATAAFLQSRRERITTRAFPGACYSHGKSWTRFAPSLAAKPICPQTSCASRKARDWGIACSAPRGALSGARSFPSPRVRIRPHLCLSLSEPQSRSFKSLSLKSVKSLSLPNQSRLLPTSRWQMPSLSTERVIGLRNARLRGSCSGSRSRR